MSLSAPKEQSNFNAFGTENPWDQNLWRLSSGFGPNGTPTYTNTPNQPASPMGGAPPSPTPIPPMMPAGTSVPAPPMMPTSTPSLPMAPMASPNQALVGAIRGAPISPMVPNLGGVGTWAQKYGGLIGEQP